jgi:ATP adenylyltransferase/5',5'''-P-1,P-4-tetraphosphate phosphorylase II
VSDPKKLLKPKGYLKQTAASTCKVYQPRVTQVNAKVQTKELTLEESLKQIHSAEASTSKPEAKLENPEVIVPEIKLILTCQILLLVRTKDPLQSPLSLTLC